MRLKSPGEHKGKKKKGGHSATSPRGTTTAAAASTKKDGDVPAKGPNNFSSAFGKDAK